jgi:hypothetical protein
MKMNKKNKLIIFGILIILIFSIFCGCTNNSNNNSDLSDESQKFVGTWRHGTLSGILPLIFNSNGDCNYQGEVARWKIDNDKLVVNFVNIEDESTFDYEFLDNDQVLILTETLSGQVDDYKKQ